MTVIWEAIYKALWPLLYVLLSHWLAGKGITLPAGTTGALDAHAFSTAILTGAALTLHHVMASLLGKVPWIAKLLSGK